MTLSQWRYDGLERRLAPWGIAVELLQVLAHLCGVSALQGRQRFGN